MKSFIKTQHPMALAAAAVFAAMLSAAPAFAGPVFTESGSTGTFFLQSNGTNVRMFFFPGTLNTQNGQILNQPLLASFDKFHFNISGVSSGPEMMNFELTGSGSNLTSNGLSSFTYTLNKAGQFSSFSNILNFTGFSFLTANDSNTNYSKFRPDGGGGGIFNMTLTATYFSKGTSFADILLNGGGAIGTGAWSQAAVAPVPPTLWMAIATVPFVGGFVAMRRRKVASSQ
jgi:hypothetical protein